MLGIKAGYDLANNGTQYKPSVQETENLQRFLSKNLEWMQENSVPPDRVPLIVVENGLWATEDDYVMSLRAARMSLAR